MLPCQQSIEQKSNNDIFMNMEFDIRNRAASISCPHRPRGSSWSQYIRPRSSTTDHKRRAQRKYKASNNSADSLTKTSEYVDMTCGSALSKSDSHARMSLDKNSKQKPAPVNGSEREDKENFLPNQLAVRVPPVSHPFPELLFTSSEDDVSLHSMDGSTSLHSLTGSADSMSTSSHSSHHSSFAPTTSLDAEAYVAMQPPPSSAYVRSASHRLLLKPAKVTSYILDDTEKSTGHADYMEMSANSYSRTKQ
ncbi:hypothetical protein EB796_004255 [Bugula neritina]|uniref:Uncharacterized protein n=1 Tax=Bugula neritina TaxID=10212 RepID=A0A7J7KGU4_BUGNE|nr:hypothetical protein EB796_004255 [Bugula neritina]